MSKSLSIGNSRLIKPLESKKKRVLGPVFSQCDCSDVETYKIESFQEFLERSPHGETLGKYLLQKGYDCSNKEFKYYEFVNDEPMSMADFFEGGYKMPECWNTIPVCFVNFMIVCLVDGLLLLMHKKTKKVEKRAIKFQILPKVDIEPFFSVLSPDTYLMLENYCSQILRFIYFEDVDEISEGHLSQLLNELRQCYWPNEAINAFYGKKFTGFVI